MSYMVETVVGMCGCACMLMISLMFFFFKQKTAYELRISDWSSDVCSSDLVPPDRLIDPSEAATHPSPVASRYPGLYRIVVDEKPTLDRKSVVSGKSVSVRVDLGGGRTTKIKPLYKCFTC